MWLIRLRGVPWGDTTLSGVPPCEGLRDRELCRLLAGVTSLDWP